MIQLLFIIERLDAIFGNMDDVDIALPGNQHQLSVNTESTQREQSVNRVSTILAVETCVIQELCYGSYV